MMLISTVCFQHLSHFASFGMHNLRGKETRVEEKRPLLQWRVCSLYPIQLHCLRRLSLLLHIYRMGFIKLALIRRMLGGTVIECKSAWRNVINKIDLLFLQPSEGEVCNVTFFERFLTITYRNFKGVEIWNHGFCAMCTQSIAEADRHRREPRGI